jgi:uncharacterized protein YeaO (DUF488 family)
MGNIYTSYFGNHRNFPVGCFTISVARFLSSNIKVDLEATVIAPSSTTLFRYKHKEITQEQYKKIYLKQLSDDRGQLKVFIKNILEISEDRDVLLLCYERDGDFCHRHTLRKVINKVLKRSNLPEVVEL